MFSKTQKTTNFLGTRKNSVHRQGLEQTRWHVWHDSHTFFPQGSLRQLFVYSFAFSIFWRNPLLVMDIIARLDLCTFSKYSFPFAGPYWSRICSKYFYSTSIKSVLYNPCPGGTRLSTLDRFTLLQVIYSAWFVMFSRIHQHDAWTSS